MGISIQTEQVSMDEGYVNAKFEKEAFALGKKYSDIMTEAEQAYNEHYGKHGKSWTVNDTVALGNYLKTWEDYSNYVMNEADPTTRDTMGD